MTKFLQIYKDREEILKQEQILTIRLLHNTLEIKDGQLELKETHLKTKDTQLLILQIMFRDTPVVIKDMFLTLKLNLKQQML